jgi:hypothetical protein
VLQPPRILVYVAQTGISGLPRARLRRLSGLSARIKPDNLRSGVSKASRSEPDINPTYQDLASHYDVAVLPARARKPKDKAKVENGVLVVERWVLARLRHQRFFSLNELNRVLRTLLADLNQRPFKELPGSRASAFADMDQPALHCSNEKIERSVRRTVEHALTAPGFKHTAVKTTLHGYSVGFERGGPDVLNIIITTLPKNQEETWSNVFPFTWTKVEPKSAVEKSSDNSPRTSASDVASDAPR